MQAQPLQGLSAGQVAREARISGGLPELAYMLLQECGYEIASVDIAEPARVRQHILDDIRRHYTPVGSVGRPLPHRAAGKGSSGGQVGPVQSVEAQSFGKDEAAAGHMRA